MTEKYYVSWIQDGGYGAAAWCHAVFDADSMTDAKMNWRARVHAQTYSGRNQYQELFAIPIRLQNQPTKEILEYYSGPPEPCEWLTYGRPNHSRDGKCHIDEKGGCGKGHLPFGCYTEARHRWEEKWRPVPTYTHREPVSGRIIDFVFRIAGL